MNILKKIRYSYAANQKHWVGDGFQFTFYSHFHSRQSQEGMIQTEPPDEFVISTKGDRMEIAHGETIPP